MADPQHPRIPSPSGSSAHPGMLLELLRTDVAEVGVTTLPVVEHLDVLEDRQTCRLTSRKPAPMNQLELERREEALHHRVVPAVPASAHAAHDAASSQRVLVDLARVLRPAVRVMVQTSFGCAPEQRHV